MLASWSQTALLCCLFCCSCASSTVKQHRRRRRKGRRKRRRRRRGRKRRSRRKRKWRRSWRLHRRKLRSQHSRHSQWHISLTSYIYPAVCPSVCRVSQSPAPSLFSSVFSLRPSCLPASFFRSEQATLATQRVSQRSRV